MCSAKFKTDPTLAFIFKIKRERKCKKVSSWVVEWGKKKNFVGLWHLLLLLPNCQLCWRMSAQRWIGRARGSHQLAPGGGMGHPPHTPRYENDGDMMKSSCNIVVEAWWQELTLTGQADFSSAQNGTPSSRHSPLHLLPPTKKVT